MGPTWLSWHITCSGKTAAQQVFSAHALQSDGNFLSAAVARHRQCARGIPAPAISKKRRCEHGLGQFAFHDRRPQHGENVSRGKGMLLHQRNNDAVVGGGGLQFAIEIDAEAFSAAPSPKRG